MPLEPGTKFGPYEILSPLGAGGMGEVYRARDARLMREVAVKVLPPAFSGDSDRLRRFEQEARATSALNHPNILAVFDIGEHNGAPFIVSELLEGETLRERMHREAVPIRGPADSMPPSASQGPTHGVEALPQRKAIQYAVQIAQGLAAAHEKGVTHRDLKPENIFITRDGRVKILDFGLAKLAQPSETSNPTSAPTTPSITEAGAVLGTVSYMSPEQVRGRPADARSDIFAFGSILYEMLAGRPAFKRDTGAETMTAILKEDPPELAEYNAKISPALANLVSHCLEKNPDSRFQSAHDLAFGIENLSNASDTGRESRSQLLYKAKSRWTAWSSVGLGALLSAAVIIAGLKILEPTASPATFSQLTNPNHPKGGEGWPPPVLDSPIVTDGARLYFTMTMGTRITPAQVSIDGGEAVPMRLPFTNAEVMGISPDGAELLVESFEANEVETPQWIVPVLGGSPRRLDDVRAHDVAWSPDKQQVAFAQGDGLYLLDKNGGRRKLYTSSGVVLWPRWSPDGKRLRFTNENSATLSSALWEIRADGTQAHELLPGWNKPAIECCGEWTRDGRYYFFQTGTFQHSDIWALRESFFGTSHPFQITAGPLSFSSPLPSPDGKRLFLLGAQTRQELARLILSRVSSSRWRVCLPFRASTTLGMGSGWLTQRPPKPCFGEAGLTARIACSLLIPPFPPRPRSGRRTASRSPLSAIA